MIRQLLKCARYRPAVIKCCPDQDVLLMFAFLKDRVIVGHLAARRSTSSHTPNAVSTTYYKTTIALSSSPATGETRIWEFEHTKIAPFFLWKPFVWATKKEESLKIPRPSVNVVPQKTSDRIEQRNFPLSLATQEYHVMTQKVGFTFARWRGGGEGGGGHVTRQRHRPSPYCFVINKRMRSWKHRFWGKHVLVGKGLMCQLFVHT